MTRYQDKNQRRRSKTSDPISLDWYIAAGSCALIASACFGQIGLASYALAAAWLLCCGVIIVYSDRSLGATESYISRYLRDYGKTGLLGIVFGACLLTSLFFALAEPSQALFLLDTEANLKALFTQQNTSSSNSQGLLSALSTIFIGLRGLLIIAVAYGGFKIFQARDDQDDMKSAARMPVMLLVVSTIIDVMSGVIAKP
jgi:hypothetical protein